MSSLQDKTIVVTGGTSGIGLATARHALASGAWVAVTGRDPEKGAKALAELGEDRALYLEHDASSRESWQRLVDRVAEVRGRIDGLVNNAGTYALSSLAAETEDQLLAVLQGNLVSAFLGMSTVVPGMRASGGGSIVNVSSSGGLMGLPMTTSYAASKWGLRGMTKVAALELAASRVRVNSVHPGMTYTPMTSPYGFVEGEGSFPASAMGRVAGPEEISGAIVYLLSDDASYTTGAEIAVDGGWTAGLAPRLLLGDELAATL